MSEKLRKIFGNNSITTDQYIALDEQLSLIKELVYPGLNDLGLYDYISISLALQNIIDGRFDNALVLNKIIKIISTEENLVIDAVSGHMTEEEAKRVITGGINLVDSKNWGVDKEDLPKEKTKVDLYKVTSSTASFLLVFCALSSNLDNLCLTESQGINFSKKYPNVIKNSNHAVFFLVKGSSGYFVRYVSDNECASKDGLNSNIFKLKGSIGVWKENERHIIIPKLLK
jgi:hypothetical protein